MNTNDFRKVIDIFGGTPAMVGAMEAFDDPTRWREVAELNRLDVLNDSPQSIELPSKSDVFKSVQPLLASVADGLNGASTIAGQISPQLTGYVAEAQRLLGEVNGVLGQVESVYTQAQTAIKTRNYKEAVRLVDWLL
jgi:hypothetical protein